MRKITRRDLEFMGTIKVVRCRTPDLRIQTVRNIILRAILSPIIVRSFETKMGNKATKGTALPDFGKLLVQNFMLIASNYGWPKMVEENDPVERGYEYKGSALIVFAIDQIYLTFFAGLRINGWIIMRNPHGSEIFNLPFGYTSKHFGLRKRAAEYKADNYKLLIEEIPLAAEHTARELIIERLIQEL
jgi:hypothetical protein